MIHYTRLLLRLLVGVPQVDGGFTFTEPTAMVCGSVDGLKDVSSLSSV